jgi:hypothetical protein
MTRQEMYAHKKRQFYMDVTEHIGQPEQALTQAIENIPEYCPPEYYLSGIIPSAQIVIIQKRTVIFQNFKIPNENMKLYIQDIYGSNAPKDGRNGYGRGGRLPALGSTKDNMIQVLSRDENGKLTYGYCQADLNHSKEEAILYWDRFDSLPPQSPKYLRIVELSLKNNMAAFIFYLPFMSEQKAIKTILEHSDMAIELGKLKVYNSNGNLQQTPIQMTNIQCEYVPSSFRNRIMNWGKETAVTLREEMPGKYIKSELSTPDIFVTAEAGNKNKIGIYSCGFALTESRKTKCKAPYNLRISYDFLNNTAGSAKILDTTKNLAKEFSELCIECMNEFFGGNGPIDVEGDDLLKIGQDTLNILSTGVGNGTNPEPKKFRFICDICKDDINDPYTFFPFKEPTEEEKKTMACEHCKADYTHLTYSPINTTVRPKMKCKNPNCPQPYNDKIDFVRSELTIHYTCGVCGYTWDETIPTPKQRSILLKYDDTEDFLSSLDIDNPTITIGSNSQLKRKIDKEQATGVWNTVLTEVATVMNEVINRRKEDSHIESYWEARQMQLDVFVNNLLKIKF